MAILYIVCQQLSRLIFPLKAFLETSKTKGRVHLKKKNENSAMFYVVDFISSVEHNKIFKTVSSVFVHSIKVIRVQCCFGPH